MGDGERGTTLKAQPGIRRRRQNAIERGGSGLNALPVLILKYMTKVIFRDIPGGKPGIFAGENSAEGRGVCWGEIGGRPRFCTGVVFFGYAAFRVLPGCVLSFGAYRVLLRPYFELRGYIMLYLGSHLCYRLCCVCWHVVLLVNCAMLAC